MPGGMPAGAAPLSESGPRDQRADASLAAIRPEDQIKITGIETFPVHRTRSVFLKVHTDAGIVGLGEPSLEGWSPTVAKAVEEMADYLIGKNPRRLAHRRAAIRAWPRGQERRRCRCPHRGQSRRAPHGCIRDGVSRSDGWIEGER